MKHKRLCWVASQLRVLAMCGAVMTLRAGAAQVDVTWHYGGSDDHYGDPNNWSPAVVPNNGENGNTYRATITSFGVWLDDIDASVDALTLNGSGSLAIVGHSFSSTFTRNDTAGSVLINGILTGELSGIRVDGSGAGSDAVLGTLANFDAATGTLTSGIYLVNGFDGGPSAALTFDNARIVTNSAELYLRGTARITDQFGNDALRALAVNNGILHVDQATIQTLGDFTNNGELDLVPDGPGETEFIITGQLTNFDPSTKTLNGGKYVLWDDSFHGYTTLLRFRGADIVTNSADVFVAAMRDNTVATGRPSIVDENGRDALRNFANNTATGRIVFLDPDFTTTATTVTNAGYFGIGNHRFYLPAGGTFEQTGGELFIRPRFTSPEGQLVAASILINGGRVTGGGRLVGATTNNGVIAPGNSLITTFDGDLMLGSASVLRFNVAGSGRGVGAGGRFTLPGYGYDGIDCTAKVTIGGKLQVNLSTATQNGSRFTPGPSDTFVLLQAQSPLVGSLQNVGSGQRLNTVDGGGSFQVNFGSRSNFDPNAVVLSAFQPNTNPATLLNISTRGQAASGERAMIGGFIVTGSDPKPVLLRALGPSLRNFGVANVVEDPILSLHNNSRTTISANDDWLQSPERNVIQATGIAPSDARESAITAMLAPGAYTGVLEGKNGAAGTSLVEVYDLDAGADSQLANISTRAYSDGGDNPLIGGMIVGGGSGSSRILVRALGPSLSKAGVTGAMDNPSLTLADKNGNTLATNDDWKQGDRAAIEATGIPPTDDREAALIYTVQPGAYTAVVRPTASGVPGNSGVALVEFYNLH
ncbi:MAG: hypothetical protein ACJ8KU_02900 [Chthoniobacterales bacterium]